MPPTDSMPIMPYPAFYVGRYASVAAEIELKTAQMERLSETKTSKDTVPDAVKTDFQAEQTVTQTSSQSAVNATSSTQKPAVIDQGSLNILA